MSNKSFVQPLPPLQNFVPPPDLIVDSLGKSNRRSASTVAEIKTWASSYFSAFLCHEGVEDLFLVWDKICTFFIDEHTTGTEREDEALKLKSQIEACSAVMSSIEVTNVVDGNLNEDEKDCISWIKNVGDRIYDVLQNQYEICILYKDLFKKKHSDFFIGILIDSFILTGIYLDIWKANSTLNAKWICSLTVRLLRCWIFFLIKMSCFISWR